MFYNFMSKYSDILVEKMKEAFALQKHLICFFNKKYRHISVINI